MREAEEGCDPLQRCFIPPLGCSVGPKADHAGEVGWMVVFNPPQSHQEAIPGPMGEEGKDKEQNHRTKGKAIALLP